MSAAPPELPQALATARPRWAPSLIWLVPLLAVLIGAGLALRALLERGPTITITFASGEGLEAGKTRIKYRNVDIGQVTHVGLSADRQRVLVSAEMSAGTEALLVEDSNFWVVRPRVAASGVSGLGTLLSGAYIGLDPGRSAERRRAFGGLDSPPLVTADLAGKQFVLRGEDLGSLDIGSPVYYRRVQVGRVMIFALEPDGRGVTLTVFVEAPYDRYVTRNSRFWHASGLDMRIDAKGVTLETESLVSVVIGGVAFEAPPDEPPAQVAPNGSAFTLARDRVLAMKPPDTVAEEAVAVFRESVRGLAIGAPVEFRGIEIGEVIDIGVDLGDALREVRLPVRMRLYPDRLRPRGGAPSDPHAALRALVGRGLRAQLRIGNLLTGQLYVALDFFPGAPKALADAAARPLQVPTVRGSLDEMQAAVARIVDRLDRVPFEQIAADLRRALADLERTLQSTDRLVRNAESEIAPQVQATLSEARRTLETANRSLAAAGRTLAEDAPLQQDLRTTLRELERAARALRVLAETLEQRPEAILRGKPEETQ